MSSADKEPNWRQILEPIISEFKTKPILSTAFYSCFGLYVFAFIYNNLQNQNALFTTAWFYDAVILSWTNLLVLPLLLIQAPWKKQNRNWNEFKSILKIHLYSPAVWIIGYLGIRLIYKLLLNLNTIIEAILNWLAS
jgi:hypothetical protein